jgi:tricarballylate dehydrogenase
VDSRGGRGLWILLYIARYGEVGGLTESADVVVAGGGNAGICAAIAAREEGATVILLERAPRPMRGGNSRHTRDIRHAHDGPDRYVTGQYSPAELLDDIVTVTKGGGDRALTELVTRESVTLPGWLTAHGVRWQRALRGTLHLSRTNRFMLGGGTAMLNSLYRAAEELGVRVRYEAGVTEIRPGSPHQLIVAAGDAGGERQTVTARAVVLAAGGFEANLDWLAESWGPAAHNFVVRGTPYNDGQVLRMLLDLGAQEAGDPAQFHGTAVDARAPAFDGGIVTRLDSVPFGVVVNRDGERFYDEGEELWPKRYAIWGGMIGRQPGQIAYSIVDRKSAGLFLPSVFPAITASSVPELAVALDLPVEPLVKTVDAYNRATPAADTGEFDPGRLDGLATQGLEPAKTNWARPLDTPPYAAYPLRPGITFTYLGVRVDDRARIVPGDGGGFPGLFAAGELMAGNVLSQGYLAGLGLTIGGVFGRIAGEEAAGHARG